jgi:hypothetical protein
MSLKETPMTRRLWQAIGGTLFEEFVAVAPGPNRGTRRLDGLVLVDERTRIAERGEVPDLADRDVIAIQTKASRFGMNVLGQALFSEELLRAARPRRIRTIALCTGDDDELRPLAERYGIEVVVDDGSGPRWLTRSVPEP